MQDVELLQRGTQLFKAGDFEGAAACLREVGAESPHRRDALTTLGQAYLALGRAEDAESQFRAAMRLKRDSQLAIHLGTSQMAQDLHDQAEATFSEALRQDPQNVELCIMLGHAQVAQGRLGEGIRAYEQAILRAPHQVASRYYLADALVRSGDVIRATSQLHYLLKQEAAYVPAILLLGDIAFHQRDFRQAVVEYCRAMAIENVDAYVYERLGRSFHAIQDHRQAFKAFETALQLDESCWSAYLGFAQLCEERKWFPKARRLYHSLSFVPEYHAEASAGLARISAYYAENNLSEEELPQPEETTSEGFAAPETLTQTTGPKALPSRTFEAPKRVTLPLAAAQQQPQQAAQRPRATQKLDEQVIVQFDKLMDTAKNALEDSGALNKIVQASRDLLPKGLDSLKERFNPFRKSDR